MKKYFAPAYHLCKKILYTTKLSHSTLLHSHMLHMSWFFLIRKNLRTKIIRFKNRFHRVRSFYSWSNHKQVDSNTNSSRIISLLVELETSRYKHKFESDNFNFLLCSHTQPLVALVIYNFKELHELLIIYVYLLCRYYHTN